MKIMAHRDISVILLFLPLACASGGGDTDRPACNFVPLVTTIEDGVADCQVVPVMFRGEKAWLALDTGAPITFLFTEVLTGSQVGLQPASPVELEDLEKADTYVEYAGTVEIGCESWRLPGYGDAAIGVEMLRGRPIVGILGLDFFSDVPAVIDYPGNRIVRYLDGAYPASYRELPSVPLHGLESGRALIDVVIDGAELTLMLDTGAHDTILIGSSEPDDGELMHVQTADGRRWYVRLGEAVLELPGEPARTVAVMRARDIGYFAPELRELGAGGLFGLTSLGWRRVMLDFETGVLRLGPPAELADLPD
jgi:hypothetical protein